MEKIQGILNDSGHLKPEIKAASQEIINKILDSKKIVDLFDASEDVQALCGMWLGILSTDIALNLQGLTPDFMTGFRSGVLSCARTLSDDGDLSDKHSLICITAVNRMFQAVGNDLFPIFSKIVRSRFNDAMDELGIEGLGDDDT